MQQALDLAKVHLESAKCRGCSHEQKLLHTIQAVEHLTRAMEETIAKGQQESHQPSDQTYARVA